MSYVYNFRMCSTDTCNSLEGGLDNTEGSVGGAGGTGAILVLVRWSIVERRP